MPYATVGEVPLWFACTCSHERMLSTLSTLPRGDIQGVIGEGRALEIACDYCGKDYAIGTEQLRGIVASN